MRFTTTLLAALLSATSLAAPHRVEHVNTRSVDSDSNSLLARQAPAGIGSWTVTITRTIEGTSVRHNFVVKQADGANKDAELTPAGGLTTPDFAAPEGVDPARLGWQFTSPDGAWYVASGLSADSTFNTYTIQDLALPNKPRVWHGQRLDQYPANGQPFNATYVALT